MEKDDFEAALEALHLEQIEKAYKNSRDVLGTCALMINHCEDDGILLEFIDHLADFAQKQIGKEKANG